MCRAGLCAARPPRRASASSPPLPHPPEVVSDAVTDSVRASVGLAALDVQTQALGACPHVRALKPTLVGEQRVVHLPERVLTRRRLGRRPPDQAKAERRRCRDIDQVGSRLRYRDLREAGVSEVLRQVPQFARRGTAVTDCGRRPLAYAPPASGSGFAPSGALMGCARSERPRRADAALTRRGLPAIAIRWRRASGAGGVNRRSDRQRRSARALPSVAKRKPASTVSGEQSDRQFSPGASRPTGP